MYSGPKNLKDIRFILNNLRDQDLEELKASHGKNWKKIVYINIRKLPYEYCFVGYSKDNKPIFMYGIVPAQNNIGIIWMLGTDEVIKEPVSLAKLAKEYISENSKKYKLLCNKVHSRNTLAIKCLKWLGFMVEKHEGIGRKDFLFFKKEFNICANQQQ